MKTTFLAILAASFVGLHCTAADATTNSTPRYRAVIACFMRELDSRSSCSGGNYQESSPWLSKTSKMTCGWPGEVSQIESVFVERRGDKDVYRFTRRFPFDTPAATNVTKTVEFSDRRVVVFQDKFQAIVIEPPKK